MVPVMTDQLHEDVRSLIKAVGESTQAIGELAIKVGHQSELHKATEERNEKRLDKMEESAKVEALKSAESRKELSDKIIDIDKRLVPVEGMSKTISSISTKLIGSLILVAILAVAATVTAIKISGA